MKEDDKSEERCNASAKSGKEIYQLDPVNGTTKDGTKTLTDLIGEFGLYQLSLTLLAFTRYMCVAIMSSPQPLVAPNLSFWCKISNASLAQTLKTSNQSYEALTLNKCHIELQDNSTYKCESWSYDTNEFGLTLTDHFDLVCDKAIYRSIFAGTVSVGVALSSVIWGSLSDARGRYVAVKLSFLVSVISGLASYFATNYISFVVSRAVCSFGDLGLAVSLTTILVETLGNKYRGPMSVIVYTGWSAGVMVLPWIAYYTRHYKNLMLVTVVIHLITLPWILWVGESIRWLSVEGRREEAWHEVERIAKWNRPKDAIKLRSNFMIYQRNFEKNFEISCSKVRGKEQDGKEFRILRWARIIHRSILAGLSKVSQLFQTRQLAMATIALICINFNGELLYMITILFNSDFGEDTKLNYNIGFLMELLATLVCLLIIARVSRRLSLIGCLSTTSLLGYVLVLYGGTSSMYSVILFQATKFMVSTLTSLIYVVVIEMFPTNLRQSGIGLTGTLGSCGAIAAPFLNTELDQLIGTEKVRLIVFTLPLISALMVCCCLRETKDCDLADHVSDKSNQKSLTEDQA